MCCSECLARSGVSAGHDYYGDDKSTAAPRLLRKAIALMRYLENGCEKARTWKLDICRRGSAGAALNALHSARLLIKPLYTRSSSVSARL